MCLAGPGDARQEDTFRSGGPADVRSAPILQALKQDHEVLRRIDVRGRKSALVRGLELSEVGGVGCALSVTRFQILAEGLVQLAEPREDGTRGFGDGSWRHTILAFGEFGERVADLMETLRDGLPFLPQVFGERRAPGVGVFGLDAPRPVLHRLAELPPTGL